MRAPPSAARRPEGSANLFVIGQGDNAITHGVLGAVSVDVRWQHEALELGEESRAVRVSQALVFRMTREEDGATSTLRRFLLEGAPPGGETRPGCHVANTRTRRWHTTQ